MAAKVALVTGASSGIGKATVQGLLQRGFTVYAAARRLDRMEDLERDGARLIALDMTDEASLERAVARIRRESGGPTVLINNAGYGSFGALEDVPPEEARRQFDVNLFGVARLTQLVLPIMREQRTGRIVNMSSIAGRMWQPFGAWYHATKFALEGLSDCLRVEVAPFGIDVVLIEPGAIRTEWSDIAADSLVERSGSGAYRDDATRYAKMLRDTYAGKHTSGPDVVAAAVLKAVTARKPKTRYAVGGGAGPVLMIKRLVSDRFFDGMLRFGLRRARADKRRK